MDDHPWHDKPPTRIEELSTEVLMHIYGILISTFKARAFHFKATADDGQQFFTPDLNTSLESYCDLLEMGVIKVSSQYWPALLSLSEPTGLDSSHLKNAIFEVNFGPPLSNSRVCSIVKKEITARIKSSGDVELTGIQCWHLLNQAYCFNAIAYRYETYGINPDARELTTSEYLDIKDLTSQLPIGWINTLCRRAFNWTANKQKKQECLIPKQPTWL